MNYPLYLFFGLAPSIIWLCYFLRKDVHPESNREVLKVFFYGALIALPAIIIEVVIYKIIFALNLPQKLDLFLNVFIGISLTEELLKYYVVRLNILHSAELDEPIDIMLYMIIAALGFASVENLLLILSNAGTLGISSTTETFRYLFTLSSFRFLSATFFHALASGLFGYFLALSFFEIRKRTKYFIIGLGLAILFHGLYDYPLLALDTSENSIKPAMIVIAILAILAVAVTIGFQKVKKMASVCKLNK